MDTGRPRLKVGSSMPWFGPWTIQQRQLGTKHRCIHFLLLLLQMGLIAVSASLNPLVVKKITASQAIPLFPESPLFRTLYYSYRNET